MAIRLRANGEEDDYPSRIASHSKGLPHDALGHVDPAAYDALCRALVTGRRLTKPNGQAHDLALPPAPRIDSPQNSGEAVELYWMALLRDVHFCDYETNARVERAVRDLNRLSDFRGPQRDGQVTPATLFRGFTRSDLAGPYVSQL